MNMLSIPRQLFDIQIARKRNARCIDLKKGFNFKRECQLNEEKNTNCD